MTNGVAAAEAPPEPAREVEALGFERNIVRHAIVYEFQRGVSYWF